MARYTDAKCKLCRREGTKLFLKGDRCASTKCAFDRRQYAPGEHGQRRRSRTTEYGLQLREKQKVKRIYGVLEAQFRNYFKRAERRKGVTGENLLRLLEARLDNVVYRLGFAPSRSSARQLVLHGHFSVDGRKVDRPSYHVKPGQKVTLRERSRDLKVVKESLQRRGGTDQLSWLSLDEASMSGTLLEEPTRDAIPLPVQEQLIVELYSK